MNQGSGVRIAPGAPEDKSGHWEMSISLHLKILDSLQSGGSKGAVRLDNGAKKDSSLSSPLCVPSEYQQNPLFDIDAAHGDQFVHFGEWP